MGPSGDIDKAIPPLTAEEWTKTAQRAWYNMTQERPWYSSPRDPLAYTSDLHEGYDMSGEPDPYELRVPFPRLNARQEQGGELASSSKPTSQWTNDSLASSPPKVLEKSHHDLLVNSDGEDVPVIEDLESEDDHLIQGKKITPRKTRMGKLFEEFEGPAEDLESNKDIDTETIKAEPADENDLKYFKDECFQGPDGTAIRESHRQRRMMIHGSPFTINSINYYSTAHATNYEVHSMFPVD
ncbi:hypothetical protein BKA63DRAFT_488404 [Paraphoma chrysanthemicola]|nr:hypothetical protein BKA63DRAFT_488404 [Paraphoma chrysanthemicola]